MCNMRIKISFVVWLFTALTLQGCSSPSSDRNQTPRPAQSGAGSSATVFSGVATLSWNPNTEPDLAGYKVYYGTTSRSYTTSIDVGNQTTYTVTGLGFGTYYFAVTAYDISGNESGYSNEASKTFSDQNLSVILTVTRADTGSGTVTSSPAGISCGSDCTEPYPHGTGVTLTATPASGSTFTGWGGDADCSDGVVTLDASKTCTATFTLLPQNVALSVSVIGSGTVTSNPSGINCPSDCSESYTPGTSVNLTATPGNSYTFTGWGGDCAFAETSPTCSLTMDAPKAVTVTFSTPDFTLSPTGSSLAVEQGSSGTKPYTIASLYGFTSAVDLTLSGAPAGVTEQFSPNPVTPPANGSAPSTLTIHIDSRVACKTYSLAVTGASSTITHTATLNLTVTGCRGLQGQYYDNADLTDLKQTRTDPQIDFDWGPGSPDAAMAPDTFSVRWTGKIQVDHNETYTFQAVTDDGVRLWMDGHLLIDYWERGGASIKGAMALIAGLHDLKLEFFEDTGEAFIKLYWSSESTPYGIVPQDHLYPPDSPGAAPELDWTAEANYTTDGLHPEAGDTQTVFTYQVKYTDADGDAPGLGYPRVHILKENREISGSPFVMSYTSGSYTEGAIYTYRTLREKGDYSYYFEAKDATGLQAVASPVVPTPTAPLRGPNVSKPDEDEDED